MRQLFATPDRTYVSYKNAKKVIDKLQPGDYSWLVATTEEGRYFPVVFLHGNTTISHFYFLDQGCCVQLN